MKRPRRVVGMIVLASVLLVPAGVRASGASLWARAHGGGGNDFAHSLAVAADGSMVIAGRFNGTASFGGDALESAGRSDIFVAAFDPAGEPRWAVGGGGKGADTAQQVALMSTGDVVVTGSFRTKADIGGTELIGVGREMFIAKLSGETGETVWAIARGGNEADHANGLVVDAQDNIVVAGTFHDSVDFGGGEFDSEGGRDLFVAKYDGDDGRHIWSLAAGSDKDDDANSIALDRAGDLFVGGRFARTIELGETKLTPSGSGDAFVMKLSGNTGAHIWASALKATGSAAARAVAADANGDALATGYFYDRTAFGTPAVSRGGRDVFLAKLSGSTGAVSWATTAGGAGHDTGYALRTDVAGDAIVGGNAAGPLSLGGDTLTGKRHAEGFLATYDGANGAHVWSKLVATNGYDRIDAVGVDANGSPIAAGWIAGNVTVGETKLKIEGKRDAFVASFSGDDVAPASAFTTASNAVLINVPNVQTTLVTGTATDDRIGVAKVDVTFSVAVVGVAVETVEATLQCTDEHRQCTWSATPPPVPGPMQVTAIATDRANNVEDPGPAAITVVNI